MDSDSFECWLNDVVIEYVDTNKLTPEQASVVNGLVVWVSAKYRLEREREAQDKFADPCCGGVCKEESDVQNV